MMIPDVPLFLNVFQNFLYVSRKKTVPDHFLYLRTQLPVLVLESGLDFVVEISVPDEPSLLLCMLG